MQTRIAHMQFNVEAGNVPFYKGLLTFLGWRPIYEGEGALGVADASGTSLWFIGQVKPVSNDYDGPGLNHLSIGTETQADVDATVTYLQEQGVELLFGTPQHRPEFSESEDTTYYQVMFETPDRILLEVVYTGPKAG